MDPEQYIKLMEVNEKNLAESKLGTRGFSSALPVQIRSVDVEKRMVRFIASDETIDRYRTIISVAGWELRPFKMNPVFLAWHDYYGPAAVVGRVMHIEKDVEKKQLIADVLFIEKDINPVAEMIFQMYAHTPAYLNAVSVGFIPYEAKEISEDEQKEMKGKVKARIRFTSQELLEISAVSVPANPSALVDKALQYGIDPVLVMSSKSMLPGIGDQDEITALATRMSGWMCKSGVCWPIDQKNTEQMSMRRIFPFRVPVSEVKLIEKKSCACESRKTNSKIATSLQQRVKDRKDGDGVLITGLWIRNMSDSIQALVEINGKWRKCINEYVGPLDVEISHICEPLGIEQSPDDDLTADAFVKSVRAGAVLNRKNKGALKQAQELIQTVLDSAEPADESEEKSVEVPGVLLGIARSEEPEWVKELKASLATVSESLDNYGRDILAAIDEINEERIVGSKSKSDDSDDDPDEPDDEPEDLKPKEESKTQAGSNKIAELLAKLPTVKKTEEIKKIADVKESAAAMVAIGRDILQRLDKPKA